MIPRNRLVAFGLCVATALLSVALPAGAQTVVVRERVYYPIEIEPHFTFGAENVYGATGLGGGLRVGIPLAFGHLGRIPQNIALSLGGDLVHYDDCYSGGNCDANYLMLPVAAQWNIGFARQFSLLLEGGIYVYKGWYDTCGPNCVGPSELGVLPTFAVGGRIHLHRNVALLFRVGYPMSTLGISFL